VQKISFGNKDYVKASEAAKRFKYTQDYVGQLCRAKKVDARLVGRVWYVNLDSITEYRKTKHTTQKKKTSLSQENKPLGRKAAPKVEPVVRPKTARYLQEVFPKEAKSAIGNVAVAYVPDDTETIPILKARDSKNADSLKLTEGTKKRSITLKVRPNTKKQIKFKANKIPEITLHSKIKVTNEVENLVPDTPKDIDITTIKEYGGTSNTNEGHINLDRSAADRMPEKISQIVTETGYGDGLISGGSVDLARATKDSSQNSCSKSRSLFLLLCTAIFLMVTSLFFIFTLGLVSIIETGASETTSTIGFSLQLAIEVLQSVFN
jgi:hypothetical protein